MSNLKWLLIGIAVLLGIYALLQVRESGYATPKGAVFPEQTDGIYAVEMIAAGDSLTLKKKDLAWTIVGHDTLKVRDHRLTALFDQVLKVSRETPMTQKADNWAKYAVDDSAGTHVMSVRCKRRVADPRGIRQVEHGLGAQLRAYRCRPRGVFDGP